MRIVVTGAGGMLAADLTPELERRGHEVRALTRAEMDVTDAAAARRVLVDSRPDAVIQCAAYTAVDDAEADEAGAFRVNADATRNVASACHEIGALFVYPSTDYVFAGGAGRPYRPEDTTAPLNAYGRSKRAGEEAARAARRALVVRTSWLYGAGGRNFVDMMLQLARERDRIEVVDDQVGRPTWTGSLARALAELTERGAEGVLHVTDAGEPVSWCGFAREILAGAFATVDVVAVPSSRFPRPAARPRYSVLDCSTAERVLGRALPPWRESLARYLGRGDA
ncbi:MAG TPA: dTDP-4-dehydrorhamnose reductase [Longimicrobiaceae bacterium]|nr:dTDP-4-dehydrorhamnose reductase [Longimicrobiaceae bacterium]